MFSPQKTRCSVDVVRPALEPSSIVRPLTRFHDHDLPDKMHLMYVEEDGKRKYTLKKVLGRDPENISSEKELLRVAVVDMS